MPTVNFNINRMTIGRVTVLGQEVPSGVVAEDGRAFIRRVGGDPARYDRAGNVLASASFTTSHTSMSGLTEVFGLDVTAEWPDGSSASAAVSVQVSVNGEDFLAWTGAAWEAQEDDEVYNSLEVFNDHCHALQLTNPRSLGFRVKLTASGGLSPILKGVHAFVEWRYDPRMDIFEMLRDRLAQLRVPLDIIHRMAAAGTTLPLRPGYVVDGTKAIKVYNLTTDPLQNTNLFSGWNSGASTLTMTGAQASGSNILVKCFGSAPVSLVKQDEVLKKTELPVTTVRLTPTTSVAHRSTGFQRDWKRGDTLRKVRERQWPTLDEMSLRVSHHTNDQAAAIYAVEALRLVMSQEPLRLPATGELPDVVEVRAGDLVDIAGESTCGAMWTCRLRLHLHQQSYRELEVARAIQMNVGSDRLQWKSDSGTFT